MSNRNFDSRVITQRLQDRNQARNMYLYNTTGQRIINNSQTTNGDTSRINNYNMGSQTMYFRGLLGGCEIISVCGNVNIPPYPTPSGGGTPPTAPVITGLLACDGQIVVSFLPPTSDGGSPITGYQYSIDGGVNFFTASSIPITISGLMNSTSYPIVIRAVNSAGPGANSNTEIGKPYSPGWATNIGGISTDQGFGIATDSFGNVYNTGYFTNPSTLVNSFSTISSGIVITSTFGTLSSLGGQEVYVAKYNSSGLVQWATTIGGIGNDVGRSIATDTFGSCYVTGLYSGTSTFINSYSSISTGIIVTSQFGNLLALGNTDAFIVKYNTNGIANWATNITGTDFAEIGRGIATDSLGNVYAAVNCDSSQIFVNSYSTVSSGIIVTSTFGSIQISSAITDAFVIKYNSIGIAQWATTIVGGTLNTSFSIATDILNNVYVTGQAGGSLGTNSSIINSYSTVSSGIILVSSFGNLVLTPGSYDAYLVKYNSNGLAQWATNITGNLEEGGFGVTTDIFGNVYATGYFSNPSTFINNFFTVSSGLILTSTFGRLSSIGSQEAYIVKYNSNGVVQWATTIGGRSQEQGRSIITDTLGNIYTTGFFTNPSTFINSYSTVSSGIIILSTFGRLSSIGSQEAYIAKYNSSGIVQWATTVGGTSIDQGLGITTDSSNNVYITGYFNNSTFINSYSTVSSGIILTSTVARLRSNGGFDAFIIKYNSEGQFVTC
jgi:hypothetical protein